MIVVVAAVIEQDGSFLVTRRLEGTHLAGLWEFPGGKIASGETHRQGLTREIREELDADVDVGALVFETSSTTRIDSLAALLPVHAARHATACPGPADAVGAAQPSSRARLPSRGRGADQHAPSGLRGTV